MSGKSKIPAVLTIAGSDSGGGAGIQADLRTYNAFKVYGCSVITAVTSQNPHEVRRVDVLDFPAVKSQLDTVLDVFPVRVAKTGMLANQEIIECVADSIRERKLELVVDPVMVSTSKVRLLEKSAIRAMTEKLFPLAKWITPNIPEAELIGNMKIDSFARLADAAIMLYESFGCNVILKSGHLANTADAADMVCYRGKLFALRSSRLGVEKYTAHGTGCTFSAALAANLALGEFWGNALIRAKAFVYGSLAESVLLGDQFCQMYPPENAYLSAISLLEYKK